MRLRLCVLHGRELSELPTLPHREPPALGDLRSPDLPRGLVNQGADPFLFALYARFAAARLDPGLVLEDAVGGHEGAYATIRYLSEAI
jgi:hypothetical protein